MSTISDYRLYKKYEPAYAEWKFARDKQNAKRLEYLKQHPEIENESDIQRGKALLRAIDVMDEHSQKRAEDMEVATETAVGEVMNIIVYAGMFLGFFVSRIKPVQNTLLKLIKPFVKESFIKNESKSIAANTLGTVIGAFLAACAGLPLMSWAAKTEVSASRKGRFEAMKKDLNNPNNFAVLTPEQITEAEENAKNIVLPKPNKITSGIKDSINTLKDMFSDSREYKTQRAVFLKELEDRKNKKDNTISEEDIDIAKRHQQILTKIVEKIDIASQDYAENAELATQALIIGIGAFGGLLSAGLNKVLNLLKVKSAAKISAISYIATLAATIGASIFAAQIQKHASKVGRFKAKQEFIKNPEDLIYIDDNKTSKIEDVEVKEREKRPFFKFLINLWKDNKEYQKYEKTQLPQEKKFYKAVENLNLSPEQVKNAKILQKNTFRTFNKIDENSQKYSESVEALGKSLLYPLSLISSGIGTLLGTYLVTKGNAPKNHADTINNGAKMVGIIVLSQLPVLLLNAYITKEQKKASRIADMMAIKELQDYKEFRP